MCLKKTKTLFFPPSRFPPDVGFIYLLRMVCVEVTLFCPTSFYLLCLMYLVLNYFILHKLYLRFLRLRRGRKFTDIFTYDLVPFQSGWWWWWGAGREEAAHAASFYWVHKTLNLTHLHPLCCHRCLSRPSCDAQKNISLPKRVQNFEFTHLNTKNTNYWTPTGGRFKFDLFEGGVDVKSLGWGASLDINYESFWK